MAVVDEVLQDLPEIHLLRHAVRQREHDRAEGRLHLRVLVQLIEHHRGDGVALQLDHDTHAVAIGLVAQIRNAFELLVVGEPGDLLDQDRLVDLVGNLGHHHLVAAGRFLLLDHGPRPHGHAAAALLVALLDALLAVDDAAGREVGPLDESPQVLDGGRRRVDQVGDRLHYLGEVVRRNVGRHADRDARGTVHDQVRQLGREHRGLLQPVVEVGDEADGVLVDVLQHRHRDFGQAGFGVAVGRGRIAVDRAEVPLPVHQRIAQREILHHAHQRVVDRHVAVRVVLAEHVADDGRALLVGAARHEAELVHRVENAAVHRLQAVAHVGQRALHDDAHRIIEERLAHLVFDQARQDAFADVRTGHDS